mmetsp:Transcript_63645/g.170357  ORF Transcript_63645/g.170357 Transcript_63645/m.170357 type:complete len:224 (+) Transcript_63645:1994-2665(+)
MVSTSRATMSWLSWIGDSTSSTLRLKDSCVMPKPSILRCSSFSLSFLARSCSRNLPTDDEKVSRPSAEPPPLSRRRLRRASHRSFSDSRFCSRATRSTSWRSFSGWNESCASSAAVFSLASKVASARTTEELSPSRSRSSLIRSRIDCPAKLCTIMMRRAARLNRFLPLKPLIFIPTVSVAAGFASAEGEGPEMEARAKRMTGKTRFTRINRLPRCSPGRSAG